MPTYRQAVGAVAKAMDVSPGHVDHVGRALRGADLLPTGAGGPTPAHLTHEQIAALMLGVLCGCPLRDVAAMARRFAGLEIEGVDFRHAKSPPPNLGQVLARALAGNVDGVGLSIDVDTMTATVAGVGDQPLHFGLSANCLTGIRRTFTLPPATFRRLGALIKKG